MFLLSPDQGFAARLGGTSLARCRSTQPGQISAFSFIRPTRPISMLVGMCLIKKSLFI